MTPSILIGVLLAFAVLCKCDIDDSLKIKFAHGGILQGRHHTTVKGRHMRAFMGVPYAQPPVGDLRFKSPVPYGSWVGVKQAISKPPSCVQGNSFNKESNEQLPLLGIGLGQEDCLYINVHTPPLVDIEKSGPLPVMVYFHGGGFEAGAGYVYSSEHLMDKDIIFINANYRLGLLGFLSSETIDCPGNFGLKDQLEVLRWIQKNIALFGGDANRVTIFGESAGSASCTYQMLSEKSKGLFHRAIPQSGSYLNPWGLPAHKGVAAGRAKKVAAMAKCDTNQEWSKIMNCLRKIPLADLLPNPAEWDDPTMFPFGPVIEPNHSDAFITKDPRDAKDFSLDIPIMMGVTAEEGAIVTEVLLDDNKLNSFKKNIDSILPVSLFYHYWNTEKVNSITSKIKKFYFNDNINFDRTNFQDYVALYSDSFINVGVDEYLEKRLKLAPKASTYVYVFNHRGKSSYSEIFDGGVTDFGVAHTDELQYLFPWSKYLFPSSISSGKDLEIREAMLDMWYNFAAYGNPTPQGSVLPKWEPATSYPYSYALIGSREPNNWYILKQTSNFEPERMAFWRQLQPYVPLEHKKDEL